MRCKHPRECQCMPEIFRDHIPWRAPCQRERLPPHLRRTRLGARQEKTDTARAEGIHMGDTNTVPHHASRVSTRLRPVKTPGWTGCGGELSADGPTGSPRDFGTTPISRMARGAQWGFRRTGPIKRIKQVGRTRRTTDGNWGGWQIVQCVQQPSRPRATRVAAKGRMGMPSGHGTGTAAPPPPHPVC